MTTDNQEPSTNGARGGPGLKSVITAARRLFAGGLLCWALVGTLNNTFEICTSTSAETTSTVCRPPTVTDAGVLVFGLIIVGLLWPDIGEFSVLGFSVKRQIAAVKQAVGGVQATTQTLSGDLSRLRQEVQQVAVSSAQSLNVNVNGAGPDAASLRAALERLVPGTSVTDEQVTTDASDDRSRAQLLHVLVTSWNELTDILNLSTRSGRLDVDDAESTQVRARRVEFSREYSDDIKLLRSIRNEAAHSNLISTENLVLGAELGTALLREARVALGAEQAGSHESRRHS